jgi:hypothetical protein
MPLVEVDLVVDDEPLPANVAWLIADAQQRIETFSNEHAVTVPAFVPSDFEVVYRGLAAIEARRLAAGRRFIEWGSGIGVITCLAEMVGFDAVGIEIESLLVEIANDLADEHDVKAQFACGSFIPSGAEPRLEMPDDVAWLATHGPDGYEELEAEADEFDVVFAYPWPGEEHVVFDLFSECASMGSLLLTYHGQEGLKLQRRVTR